jgi:hypothetical protein
MKVLLVEAIERSPAGVPLPIGVSKDATCVVDIVKRVLLSLGVTDADYVVRCVLRAAYIVS